MERLSRYGILIARVMISMVFLVNALGVIDQTEAARELAARGAPSNLVPFLVLVGRSVELIGGFALAFGIFPRVAVEQVDANKPPGNRLFLVRSNDPEKKRALH
jgi:uncharacterized membrane protein YphA (DoxX/SURF4 family)